MKRSFKRLLSVALAVALFGSLAAVCPALAEETGLVDTHILADADGTSTLSTTDARLTLQYAAGKIGASALLLGNVDVDYSDGVDTTDARLILQAASGKITLKVDEPMKTMADMPGLAVSPAFGIRARTAEGGHWQNVGVFAFKSDRLNHMARVTSDEAVEVEVTNLAGAIKVWRLEPHRYGVTPTVEGNRMTFVAQPLQKYAIQFSDTNTWLVFVVEPTEKDAPDPTDKNVVNVMDYVVDNTGKTDVYSGLDAAITEVLTNPDKDTVYFPDGIYRTHSIELSLAENVSFYFSEGARILWDENCWGSNIFRLSGCTNIRFYGRGIIDATYRIHKGRGADGKGWWDAVNATHLSGRVTNGMSVDGLWFFDTPNSPMRSEGADNVSFYNTKYINNGGIMNDNLVIYGGSHVTFEEGIGIADDDSWSAHTAAWGGFNDTRDVIIRNSTYISDNVAGRGGICYGCNESNPDGASTWNVLYENLSLVDYGQALDNYNVPSKGCKYGNFIFRNVDFETPSSTNEGFDHFQGLSGIIVLEDCKFASKGGSIVGNPSAHVTDLYVKNLTMAGKQITSPEEGNIKISNVDNVHWNEAGPASFAAGPVTPPEKTIPVSELPFSDNFDDNTMDGWTDLSGSHSGNVKTTVEKDSTGYHLKLSDLESAGVAGVIKRFTPQGAGRVVEIEAEMTPRATSEIVSVYINDLVGACVAGVRFYNNGNIRFFGTKGSDFDPGKDLMMYKANTTYHLKWVIDVSAARYDLYIGEGDAEPVKMVGNVPFKCPLSNVASIRFDTESIWLVYAGQRTTLLVDNVSVSAKDSDGTLFDPDDTDIHYAGNVEQLEMINGDDSTHIAYQGRWQKAGGRGMGDYNDDVFYTETNGDSVTFTFEGTGVKFFTETNSDEGDIEVVLDGKTVATVSAVSASRAAQQAVYSVEGLTKGKHTLKLTKKSGQYMLVDAFGIKA